MSIYIRESVEYNDMQGPCPDGFHVPLNTELSRLQSIMSSLGQLNNMNIYLKMPLAGFRSNSGSVYSQGSDSYYASCTMHSNGTNIYELECWSGGNTMTSANSTTNGRSIRPFKNEYVEPDSSRTVILGSLGSNGVFWNQTNGLISLTNGTYSYTIADKNLGATTVWNNGDTLSEANCGKYYQRGNNYGFPWTGSVTTSGTRVNASTYGPGNYYESSTFITSNYWDSSSNKNLRGGVSQGSGTKLVQKEVKNIYIGEIGWQPGENTLLYLPLNGDLVDKSSNQNNGTWGGTGAYSDIIPGSSKKCAYFNSNSYIELTSQPVTGNPTFTHSCWFKTNSEGLGFMHTFGYDSRGRRSVLCIFYSPNKRPLQDTYGTDIYMGSATDSSKWNTWLHCVYTYDGNGNHKFYINGALYGTGSGSLSITSGYHKEIGRSNQSISGYMMSECIIEDKVRTVEEIEKYYNKTKSNYGL